MKILVSLGRNPLLPGDEPAWTASRRGKLELVATALAGLAAEHRLIVTHGFGAQAGHLLELALRNALPGRDVVSVLTQVVVAGEEPHAIPQIRSLRVLLDSGAVVVCACEETAPVSLDPGGSLRRVVAAVDEDLTAALLARRLDADLFLSLTQAEGGSIEATVKAASSFARATGRRAAIGSLSHVGRIVGGEAGTQVMVCAPGPPIAAVAARNPATGAPDG